MSDRHVPSFASSFPRPVSLFGSKFEVQEVDGQYHNLSVVWEDPETNEKTFTSVTTTVGVSTAATPKLCGLPYTS